MNKFFSVCVAAIAILTTTNPADAQGYHQGYQFGTGFRSFDDCGRFGGFNGGFYRSYPREQLPYFAQFPPVYYSHIVPRPIGYSPYALPPGIMPAEMHIAPPVSTPNPEVIPNPHFGTSNENGQDEQASPVQKTSQRSVKTVAKSRSPKWQSNPYFVQPQTEPLALLNFVE